MSTLRKPIDVPQLDAERVIRKGLTAWGQIKASAAETRLQWLEIGNALLIGRQENPSNQAFGQWCEARGFGDMDARLRSDAMWVAENWEACSNGSKTEAHPTRLRMAYRKATRVAQAKQDLKGSKLDDAPAPGQRTELAQDTARRVIKTHHRAQAGGEGADIAAKQLESYARLHGRTVEELLKAAAEKDPDGYYRFEGNLQRTIDQVRTIVKKNIAVLKASGMDPRAIRDVLVQLANAA